MFDEEVDSCAAVKAHAACHLCANVIGIPEVADCIPCLTRTVLPMFDEDSASRMSLWGGFGELYHMSDEAGSVSGEEEEARRRPASV